MLVVAALLSAGLGVPPRGEAAAVEGVAASSQPIRVRTLTIRGLDALTPPVELPVRLPLSPGAPYTAERLAALEAVIRAAFAERGHPYVELEVAAEVDEAAGLADVEVDLDAGVPAVFGPVTIQVEAPLTEADVEERLQYAAGEPFRPSALEETVRLLRALPVTDPGGTGVHVLGLEVGAAVLPTIVVVPAARVQGLELEGTLSSADCLRVAGYWRHRYFLGEPRVFSAGAGLGNLLAGPLGGDFPCTGAGEEPFTRVDYFVDTELRQPWPGEPRAAFGVRAFVGRETVPRAYVREGLGARLVALRELGFGATGIASYFPQRQSLSAADLYFCGNFGVCERQAIDALARASWLSPLEAELYWAPFGEPLVARPPGPEDVRRWLEPWVWRFWARGRADLAGGFTGSDHRYLRASVEGAATRFFGRFELAGRGRAGAIGAAEDVLPPQVRFFSGGFQTVRGAQQNRLGPRLLLVPPQRVEDLGCVLEPGGCPPGTIADPRRVQDRPTGGDAVVEANLEARTWVGARIQFAAFADYGILFRRVAVGPAPFELPSREGLLSPGVGVRALTRLGPVRVDVGYDPRSPRAYPLFTEDPETRDLIFLGDVVFDPYTWDEPSTLRELWRRLQLHVAMAQPF